MRYISSIFLLAVVVITEGKQFRSDYTYNADADGWFKFHRVPAVWREARLRCHLEGSELASPTNDQLYSALKTLVKKNHIECGVYTGVHATFSKGDFFSIEGVPLKQMPIEWMPEEPNNYNNSEECIVMATNGSLADVSCSETLPYICYKKKTKNMVVNGCGTIDNGYTLSTKTGNCYKFHTIARTWSRAYMACAAEGGHLAIPNSQEESIVMKELFEKNPPKNILQVHNGIMRDIMHIGFHDWSERGDWVTIHGQSLQDAGFNQWSGGQPDNSTAGEFCGGMFRNGLLDDLWCEEIGPFICEKSPDSLYAGDD